MSTLTLILSSLANYLYVACLLSAEVVIARTSRRISLALSLNDLPVWDFKAGWGSLDLITRRTIGVSILVARLISTGL